MSHFSSDVHLTSNGSMFVDGDGSEEADISNFTRDGITNAAAVDSNETSHKNPVAVSQMFDYLDSFTKSPEAAVPREYVVHILSVMYDKWVQCRCTGIDDALKKFRLKFVQESDPHLVAAGARIGDLVFTSKFGNSGKVLANQEALDISLICEIRILHTVQSMANIGHMTNKNSGVFKDASLHAMQNRVYHVVLYTHIMVRNWLRTAIFSDDELYTRYGGTGSSLGAALSGTRMDFEDMSKATDYMRTFLFVIRYMSERQLRQHLDFVYKQRSIDAALPVMSRSGRSPLCAVCNRGMHMHSTKMDGRIKGHAFQVKYEPIVPTKCIQTRSWERYTISNDSRVNTLEDFVRHCCSKERSWEAFNWCHRKSRTVVEAANYLSSMRHVECPKLDSMIDDMSLSTRSGVIRFEVPKHKAHLVDARPEPRFYPYTALRDSMKLPAGQPCAEDLDENFASAHFVDCFYHPADLMSQMRGKRLSTKEAKGRPKRYRYENYVEHRCCTSCGVRVDKHFVRGVERPCGRYSSSCFECEDTWEYKCAGCGVKECNSSECGCPGGFQKWCLTLDAAMSIKTDLIDGIWEYQGMDTEAIMWLYIMIGRLFSTPHKFEKWRVGLMVWGFAGTGKSTLCDIISALYQTDDVAVLQNISEGVFGLQSIISRSNVIKRIVMMREMKEDCNLQTSVVQSLVTGESINVARKGQVAVKIDKASTYFVTVGNALPKAWLAGSDAITRRFPAVRMAKAVPVHLRDTQLMDRIKNRGELVSFWIKSLMLYLTYSDDTLLGSGEIWNGLPPYYYKINRMLRSETNVIYCFLLEGMGITERDGDDTTWVLKQSDELYMSFDEFTKVCRGWASSMGKPRPIMSPDTYENAFSRCGLRIETSKRKNLRTSTTVTMRWVIGLGWSPLNADGEEMEVDVVAEVDEVEEESKIRDAKPAASALSSLCAALDKLDVNESDEEFTRELYHMLSEKLPHRVLDSLSRERVGGGSEYK